MPIGEVTTKEMGIGPGEMNAVVSKKTNKIKQTLVELFNISACVYVCVCICASLTDDVSHVCV